MARPIRDPLCFGVLLGFRANRVLIVTWNDPKVLCLQGTKYVNMVRHLHTPIMQWLDPYARARVLDIHLEEREGGRQVANMGW